MLSIKEQVIFLQLLGASLTQQWAYLRAWSQQAESNEVHQLPARKANQPDWRVPWQDYPKYASQVETLARQALFFWDPAYPATLRQIPKAPAVLYCQGSLGLLGQPLVSIVGTRSMTAYGGQVAQALVQHLMRAGFSVVSGLAKGVDGVVHRTALAQGRPGTIGVIATGFNYTYPRDHVQLQAQMGQHQLLLSEYLPDTGIRKHQFVMRNRIIAGLSPATIVVEAAQRSGSLITANYALQFNREVLAVPGPIQSAQSRGCHDLIELGSRPVLGPQDCVDYLTDLYQHQGYVLEG